MSGYKRIAVFWRLSASMGAWLLVCLPAVGQGQTPGGDRLPPESTGEAMLKDCDNPYAGVDWDSIEYLHSVSHQHSGHSESEIMRTLDALWKMGIRHFPLSNYYPSRPIYHLPPAFLAQYPAALAAPNAEHAAFDSGDFNGLGSFYTAGSPWSRWKTGGCSAPGRSTWRSTGRTTRAAIQSMPRWTSAAAGSGRASRRNRRW